MKSVRTFHQRTARRTALVAAALLTLSAWAPVAVAQTNSRTVPAAEWNRILEAGRKEGKVVLYGTMAPPVHDRIVAAFNSAYPGIKMEIVRVIGTAI